MNQIVGKKEKIYYFNPEERLAAYHFGEAFSSLLENNYQKGQELIFLCIGSDRATGDCLGPILGYKLTRLPSRDYFVYGTLDQPVHAKNLADTIQKIYRTHIDPFIVAIDSSLGRASHIGYVTLGKGPLKPGAGVDKDLPSVGNLFITGIVNLSGMFDHMLLQTTRLNVVMSLADHIYFGIRQGIRMCIRGYHSFTQSTEEQII